MSKLKVALISAGMISNCAHIPAYQNLSEYVDIVGVADLNETSARDTAQRHGIPHYYTDAAQMLAEQKPDLVSVCTPNAYHKENAELALRAGAHVACEKPMALTYQDTKALFDLAAAQGKKLFACQSSRFGEGVQAAREFHRDGVLGDVYFSEFNIVRRRGIPTWGNFHQKAANGGGAFCDLGVHMIDSILYVIGNPALESITGSAYSRIARSEQGIVTSLSEAGAFAGLPSARPYSPEEFEVEEFATGSIKFAGDIRINFKVSWAVNLPPEFSIKIVGDKAGLSLPDLELYSTLGRYQTDFKPRLFGEGEHDSKPFSGHYYLMEQIVGCLRGECEAPIQPEETLNVAKVIDAFYLSAELGREVRAEEIG